jgi:uroporphyrin-3 C-methyltransferase
MNETQDPHGPAEPPSPAEEPVPRDEPRAVVTAPPASAPQPPPSSRVGPLTALLVLIALAALAWFAWTRWRPAEDELGRLQSEVQALQTQLETAARSAEQARRDAGSLHERFEDAAKVNQSLREQLLGLSERARLTEDAIANLADKRLSGHDALLLNEAEMLLALGAERYTLFHDVAATLDAYRLADSALAASDDAAFASVRQSVAAEIDAFAALDSTDPRALLGRLAALRNGAADLPPAPRGLGAPSAQAPRWQRLLGEFVRVRHGDSAAAIAERHEPALARQLFVLDLRDAESALLARDQARYRAALDSAQARLRSDFDGAAAAVAAARTTLAELGRAELAPAPPPAFGAALRELRNLRATHALQEKAPAAAPTPDPPRS